MKYNENYNKDYRRFIENYTEIIVKIIRGRLEITIERKKEKATTIVGWSLEILEVYAVNVDLYKFACFI